LGELACADAEAYGAKALALARDTDLLDALHKNLRPMMLASPLMDTQNYIRELEAGFRQLAGALAVRR
jgi:predicted O-linked N-acetylglucosamine transferase (SPINDLY family)